ncbi:hypothetical protein GQ54DRAFT_47704 [Martensiomyces pterosporus]|nr:hypothetical protein GQ54DRAFT_47704 [Martensiomyces pterosporus]
MASPSRISRTIDRTWDQCEWLQKKITQSLRLQVLPSLSDRPNPKRISEPLYAERQRAQIERWLNRLGSREDICENGSFDHFISTKMTSSEIGGSGKQSFSSKLLNLFSGTSDQGFRVYTPIGEINDFDEDEEERRREYINRTEEYALELAEAITNMHTQEEVLDKSVVKVALAVKKAFRSDSISPYDDSSVPCTSVDDRARSQIALELLQNASEANYWNNREIAKWKDYNLVDAVTEYCSMLSGVRDIMNNSTQTLILYEKAMQRHQSYVAKANGLRIQYPSDTPSVKYANEQEAQSERELELAHQEYTDSCDIVKKELVRYERERAHGTCKALENTAALELESARARCQELRAACRRIKNMQLVKDPPHPRTTIGPMLWQTSAQPATPTPSALASSFIPATTPSTATPTFNDRYILGGFAASNGHHSHHKHSSSGGGGSSSSSADGMAGGQANGVRSVSLRRARTLDNADFVSSSGIGSNNGSSGGSSFNPLSSNLPSSKPKALPTLASSSSSASSSAVAVAGGSSSSPSSPQGKKRWNGRISTLPYQGYDPSADTGYRLIVDRNRLAEMEAEAEMEDELVRSGMLTARQITRKKTGQAHYVSSPDAYPSPDVPPVLPAFRTSASTTSLSTASQHRHTNSYGGVSTIPQPVSASAYLQYSRQNLSASLSGTQHSRRSPGPAGAAGIKPAAHHMVRKDKGKGHAYAV